MAHELTEVSREGGPLLLDVRVVGLPLRRVSRIGDILREAPTLSRDPSVGAVLAGRNLRGGVVVVVLHGEDWSLLVRSADRGPRAWLFLGTAGGGDVAFELYGDGDLLSVQFTEMLNAVLARVSADRAARGPYPS